MASLATLTTSLRNLASDGPADKIVYGEPLGYDPAFPVNGTNLTFRLKNTLVVTASAYYTIVGTGAVVRSQSSFSVTDSPNGIVAFTAGHAPNPGAAPNGIWIDYAWQWFADAKYTEFITEGARNLQLSATGDPTTIPEGLIPAMLQYALANLFRARASLYQEKYSSSGGDAGQSVESVAKGFAAMANAADKRGDSLRDSYYQNQGQRLQAAWGSPTTYRPPAIDPITPER